MAPESDTAKLAESDVPAVDWRGRQSFWRYLRDVAIAAVLLGVFLFFYSRAVETDKQVRNLGKQAKELMLKDTPASYAKAEKNLLDMVALKPSFAFAVASLGELYNVRWQDMGIEADASKAKEWAQRSGKLDARINEKFGAVILGMLGEKKYPEAEKYALDITKVAASSHVVNGLGRALRGQGKLDEARIALKKSADTEWRNPRFACDFADLFFEDGDYANALSFYNKAVEANTDHARALIGRSRAQIARGQRIKDATDTLTEVMARPADQLSPRLTAMANVAMAELRLFEQKPDEALKFADAAVAASQSYPWSHFAKGRAMAASKDLASAQSFDKAIELDRFIPVFYYDAATAMHEAGDSAKATALLDAYLKSLKEDDRLHLAYGTLLMKMAKPDDALTHFEKAISLNSFNATAHFAKGSALFEAKKDMDGARKELDLALQVQDFFPDAHIKIGEILFAKKEWADACQSFAQAIIQMKQMQAPREKMAKLRDDVNDKLVKVARQREMAKAWMTESGALMR